MVRKSVRFVAPIALAAVTLGVYLIVHSALTKPDSTISHASTLIVNDRRGATHADSSRRGPKYYIVRPGDTLSSIASRTGVTMAALTSLNPALAASPNSLQTGQRLRLRR